MPQYGHRRLAALFAGLIAAPFVISAAPSAAQEHEAPPPNEELREAIGAADVAAGQSLALRCIGCHSFNEGEANRAGPNLYGVVGAPIGHREDFNYSPAFEELHAAGAVWTYEELDAFLTAPTMHIPGTAMSFPGVPAEGDRVAIIAYLRSLADEPLPLDADAAAMPAEEDGAAAAADAPAQAAPSAGGGLQPITFTSTEASRGRSVYNANCAACHIGGEGGGRVGPDLTTPEGWARWGAGTVAGFYNFIKSAMPLDEPGSLSDEQYRQITAYLAQVHGAEAGSTPLPEDPAAMQQMGFSN